MEDRKGWIWMDELRYEVSSFGGTVWVFRDKKEAYKAECLLPTFMSCRTSVMIWGSISLGAEGPMIILLQTLLTGLNYIKSIVDSVLRQQNPLFF